MLSTVADNLWSNEVCKRMVEMIKEGIKKVKGEEDVSRQMAMTWTVVAKNCLSMKTGFSTSQLVLGRSPTIPNLMGENSSSILERGQEE